MRNRMKIIIISFLSVLALSLNLHAEEFNITAKEIIIDKKNEILIGKGDVKVQDTKGKIFYSDKVTYKKSIEYILVGEREN